MKRFIYILLENYQNLDLTIFLQNLNKIKIILLKTNVDYFLEFPNDELIISENYNENQLFIKLFKKITNIEEIKTIPTKKENIIYELYSSKIINKLFDSSYENKYNENQYFILDYLETIFGKEYLQQLLINGNISKEVKEQIKENSSEYETEQFFLNLKSLSPKIDNQKNNIYYFLLKIYINNLLKKEINQAINYEQTLSNEKINIIKYNIFQKVFALYEEIISNEFKTLDTKEERKSKIYKYINYIIDKQNNEEVVDLFYYINLDKFKNTEYYEILIKAIKHILKNNHFSTLNILLLKLENINIKKTEENSFYNEKDNTLYLSKEVTEETLINILEQLIIKPKIKIKK